MTDSRTMRQSSGSAHWYRRSMILLFGFWRLAESLPAIAATGSATPRRVGRSVSLPCSTASSRMTGVRISARCVSMTSRSTVRLPCSSSTGVVTSLRATSTRATERYSGVALVYW